MARKAVVGGIGVGGGAALIHRAAKSRIGQAFGQAAVGGYAAGKRAPNMKMAVGGGAVVGGARATQGKVGGRGAGVARALGKMGAAAGYAGKKLGGSMAGSKLTKAAGLMGRFS